jgi:hypothetical protein
MNLPTGPVDNFLHQQVPASVWHYTSVAGLEGILSSNTVWATDARYTNDTTEFIHAKDIALGYLDRLTPADKFETSARDHVRNAVIEAFNNGALSTSITEVYLASFSAEGDLRGQWNIYGNNSQGISLAFDLRSVRPPREYGIAATVAPCIYDLREKERVIAGALSHLMDYTAKSLRRVSDKQAVANDIKTYEIIQRIYGQPESKQDFLATMDEQHRAAIRQVAIDTNYDLLRIAAHCKHHSFAEEKEWRLALLRPVNKPLGHIVIEHRDPDNKPYIASNLFQESGKLPITKVILGPLCTKIDKIGEILKQNGYDIPVEKSAMPLRGR